MLLNSSMCSGNAIFHCAPEAPFLVDIETSCVTYGAQVSACDITIQQALAFKKGPGFLSLPYFNLDKGLFIFSLLIFTEFFSYLFLL